MELLLPQDYPRTTSPTDTGYPGLMARDTANIAICTHAEISYRLRTQTAGLPKRSGTAKLGGAQVSPFIFTNVTGARSPPVGMLPANCSSRSHTASTCDSMHECGVKWQRCVQ